MMPLFAGLAALAISMALISLMVRLAPALGLMDQPSPRKVHATPIPRVGGVGIVLGALIPIALLLPHDRAVTAYLLGSVVLLAFGLWDDVAELGHYTKFIGQFAAVLAVVYYGDIYVTTLPLTGLAQLPPEVGKPFTVFAMVGVINAINHSDGLDGLAGGESILSLGCLLYLAFMAHSAGVITITAAVIGGIFGFLRYNSHPARVFMGDGGSQFLGFTLGFLTIVLTQRVNPALSPALPALIIGLPVADILGVLYLRIRGGMNWFRATKNHIHHRLLGIGFDHYGAVVIIYSVQAFFVIAAFFLRFQSDALILGIYVGVCAALFTFLTVAERRGRALHGHDKESRLRILVEKTKAHPYFRGGPAKLVAIAVPAFLVTSSFMVYYVPRDFGGASLALFAVLAASLVIFRHTDAIQNRLVVYVTASFAVYLLERYPVVPADVLVPLKVAFFVIVTVALALAIRYTDKDVFRTSPMDYLVALVVIFVGVTAGRRLETNGSYIMLVEIIIMFYGAESILNRTVRRWNLLYLSTLCSLLILAARGLS